MLNQLAQEKGVHSNTKAQTSDKLKNEPEQPQTVISYHNCVTYLYYHLLLPKFENLSQQLACLLKGKYIQVLPDLNHFFSL